MQLVLADPLSVRALQITTGIIAPLEFWAEKLPVDCAKAALPTTNVASTAIAIPVNNFLIPVLPLPKPCKDRLETKSTFKSPHNTTPMTALLFPPQSL